MRENDFITYATAIPSGEMPTPVEIDQDFRIRHVAVIGAGPAGRAFAFRCAAAGFHVVLEDVMPSKLRRAQDQYAEWVPGAGAVQEPRYASTVEDAVQAADLAIDFVPDELESKLEIFSLLDRMAPPRTILCTPTRALSITDLASCTYRAPRCVGLRSGGVDLLRDGGTVEIVRSRFVAGSVVAAVATFLTNIQVKWQMTQDDIDPMLVKNAAHSGSGELPI